MTFQSDVRLAFRRIAASPGFAAVAILTLALGIGANSAVFSLINRLLLRPLPVTRPAELVSLNQAKGSDVVPTFSYPDYRDFRDRNPVLSGLAAYRFAPMSLTAGGVSSRLWGYLVTGNYFEVLGVTAGLGRTITLADDVHAGAHPVMVLSYGCWQRRFAGDPAIAGKTARINGLDYTILGVAPRSFTGTELFYSPEVYVPMAMAGLVEPGSHWLESRRAGNIFVIGRLRPGVASPRAEAALNSVAAGLGREYPEIDSGMGVRLSPPGMAGTFLRGPVIGFTSLLLGVTALVLLIACVNLAGLLLARASDRRKEIALCLALGAGRLRLVRQMLVESLALSAAGAAAGLLLAVWLTDAVRSWRPPIDIPLDLSSGVDGTVVGFTCAIALATTLFFGLAPALAATRGDLLPALKNTVDPALRRWALRDVIVAFQVALSVLLLAGSVLVLRSLQNALNVHLGFEPRGAVVVSFDLALQGYDEARGRDFQHRLLDRVRALPGVESAGLADRLPLSMDFSKNSVYIEGKPVPKAAAAPSAFVYDASPGFFHSMRTELIAGRDFEPRDGASKRRFAIVNRAFADRLLPGEQPLGKRFRFRTDGDPREIVGVVETGKQYTLGERSEPAVWEPLDQDYSSATAVVVRSAMPADHSLALLRRTVLELDPGLAFDEADTLTDHLRFPLLPARTAGAALAAFGAVALLLAAIGVYGLMAYAVARRTLEIGIRVALGARDADVLRGVLGRAALLLGSGVLVGAGAALAAGPWYSAILYNIDPHDPVTLAVSAALMLLIGFSACLLPARRALGISPSRALREE